VGVSEHSQVDKQLFRSVAGPAPLLLSQIISNPVQPEEEELTNMPVPWEALIPFGELGRPRCTGLVHSDANL
jgi:hypothetical protein